ncbi:hypothetical protein QVD17_10423 [Tagetes erecta]|uniref:Uncharacterized protein n=1 Tax=Tagetes erecta TaxID=13708 RepID=A0AAD8L7X1_TARER|nr:hypothetical protein QVD17_10423 [Tagetes erecta]
MSNVDLLMNRYLPFSPKLQIGLVLSDANQFFLETILMVCFKIIWMDIQESILEKGSRLITLPTVTDTLRFSKKSLKYSEIRAMLEVQATFGDNILKNGGSEKLNDEALKDSLEKKKLAVRVLYAHTHMITNKQINKSQFYFSRRIFLPNPIRSINRRFYVEVDLEEL